MAPRAPFGWIAVLAVFAVQSSQSSHARAGEGDAKSASEIAPADKARCTDAFADAQSLREQGKLLGARDALRVCADVRCPSLLRKKCLEWLPGLELDIPSIVVSAVDADGHDVVDGAWQLDGKPIEAALGAAVEADPGPHTLRIERPTGATIEQRVVVGQGYKNRRVDLRFDRPREELAPLPPAHAPSHIQDARRTAGLVAFGLGAAGLVVGVVAGGVALSRGAGLRSGCAGADGCTWEEIEHARTIANASTIGFAVAGSGAVLAVALLLFGRKSPAKESVIELAPSPAAHGLGVAGRF